MKILICDDNESNRLLHKTVIRRLAPDSIIETAIDGEVGLWKARFASISFDLIVTDYNMPKLNGGEMIQEIRKFQPKILSICITSDDTYKHETEFDFSIRKPITKNSTTKNK